MAGPSVPNTAPIAIPIKSPLRSPLRFPNFSLRKTPSLSEQSTATWEECGYATLPNDDRFQLTDVLVLDDANGSASVPSYHSLPTPNDLFGRRTIPRNAPFTLEYTGTVPPTITFELKALGPALLQAGEYALSLTWLAENGDYLDIAACRSIEFRFGKKTFARSESNYLHISKLDGRGAVFVTKENWMQRSRRDRDQQYKWILTYAPLEPFYFRSPPSGSAPPAYLEEENRQFAAALADEFNENAMSSPSSASSISSSGSRSFVDTRFGRISIDVKHHDVVEERRGRSSEIRVTG